MADKKRLFLLHTMPFVMDKIIGPLERAFLEEHPDVEIQTMLDTSLLADTMADGRVSEVTGARLLTYVQQAERAGADMLLLTCTSMGAGLAHVGEFSDLPTLAITEPMMKQALDLGFQGVGSTRIKRPGHGSMTFHGVSLQASSTRIHHHRRI